MSNKQTERAAQRDARVLDLYEQLLEIEQRLITVGLHVFGQPSSSAERLDLLRMIVAFDRPEAGARALPDLVATSLGLAVKSEAKEQDRFAKNKIDSLVTAALQDFLANGSKSAVAWLESNSGVAPEDSLPVFSLLESICAKLETNSEVESLVRGLRGEFIVPGPGADIVQNPDVLPTGRNTHAINPYSVPSIVAFARSEAVVNSLLNRYLSENGRYPKAMALVLWGLDNIKTQGEGVAQALWLLGVRPVRDSLNRATEVEAIPLA